MRFLLISIVSVTCFVQLAAQTTDTTQIAKPSDWLAGGLSSLTFSQVSLDNWAAGGENSASINTFLSLFADKRKNRSMWQNTLDMGYGLLRQGENRVLKSDDRINLNTKYGRQITKDNKKWFFNGFIDFRTQFAPGFAPNDPDSVISRFMSPAYLTIGSGVEYSPNAFLSFAYTPVAGKITIVNDDAIVGALGAYGVLPGENTRSELGSFFRFKYKQEAFKNINVDMRLELFTNYERTNFGNIDVNWQNNLVMKVNKYIATTLFTQVIYDDDIIIERRNNAGEITSAQPRTQFKSVFGVGVTYAFGDSRPKE